MTASSTFLVVPNAPGPGPWVDCSAVGEFPEGQLDAAATSADLVNLETAAIATAVVGKFVQQFTGGVPSATILEQNARGRQSKPIAFARAVRVAGSTAGLNLHLAPSSLSNVGPPGPAGFPVQGTISLSYTAPFVTLDAGSRGIASVLTTLVNGINQVQVVFSAAFANKYYSMNCAWWQAASPPNRLLQVGWNTPPNPDGRLPGTVIFTLLGATGTPVDATTQSGGIMIACG